MIVYPTDSNKNVSVCTKRNTLMNNSSEEPNLQSIISRASNKVKYLTNSTLRRDHQSFCFLKFICLGHNLGISFNFQISTLSTVFKFGYRKVGKYKSASSLFCPCSSRPQNTHQTLKITYNCIFLEINHATNCTKMKNYIGNPL